jgi:hypothetical protein
MGRAGASKIRRLILLLSVGWLPPYLLPSDACLTPGSSVLYQPHNAAEGYTKPGRRLFRCTVGPSGVISQQQSGLTLMRLLVGQETNPPY